MNVLGAIGTLMDGTVLKDILCSVYGENTTAHMMADKSIQRAFRGHLLVDKCLNRILLSDMANENPDIGEKMIEECEAILHRETTLETLLSSDTVGRITTSSGTERFNWVHSPSMHYESG